MKEDIFVLSGKLVRLVTEKRISIAFAESCTGGLIGASITDISGASDVFLGSAVTYSNESKHNILGVDNAVFSGQGAVSEECAVQMAVGARRIFGSDICLSVTGIAGPDGGSTEKPVGTVWFGYSSKQKEYAFVRCFNGNRNDIRNATVYSALLFLIEDLS